MIIERHSRNFEDVKREGRFFGKYHSRISDYGEVFFYIEYLKKFDEKEIQVWSWGRRKDCRWRVRLKSAKDINKAIKEIIARCK